MDDFYHLLNNLVEINRKDYYSDTEYYMALLNQKEVEFIPKEIIMKEKIEFIIKKFKK